MYYYAFIDPESGVCLAIEEHEEPYDNQYYIQLDFYDESLLIRKKYVNGEWVDTTADEAQREQARHIGIDGEWLDERLYRMEGDIWSVNDAVNNHTHTDYAYTSDLIALQDAVMAEASAMQNTINMKANANHVHTDYAYASDVLVLQNALITEAASMQEDINGKADIIHSHNDYANIDHAHDNYAVNDHDHDLDYAPLSHAHVDYATNVSLDELAATVSTKANASHSHDDRYYTETEIDTKLSIKADSTHNHAGLYDVNGAASEALDIAKGYTDSKIDALVGNGASTTLDTIGEISSAIEDNQEAIDLLNSAIAGKANATHNHSISNITNLQTTLDGKASSTHTHTAVEVGAAASSHSHNDVYYTEVEVDTLLSGKANSSHTHSIANVSGLQSALDGKAASSHGTHVSYSTTAPVMDGTASVGTASTVARSDHKHPTDTSRAAQTSLDSHTSNKSNPHGVSLSQLGITATAAELNALDGITATVTELNYVDGVTSNIQTQLNGKAASGHTHSNVSTSAAGFMSASDKSKLDGIASGANAYTLPTASSTLGGVKTTSTVTSASGYTACPIIGGVPYYKDTNTTYSLGSFGITATSAELNYVDGVTSNIQTQLNGKASSSHDHSGVYANASHSHTAANVGAIATSDVATVSEVETYLGI